MKPLIDSYLAVKSSDNSCAGNMGVWSQKKNYDGILWTCGVFNVLEYNVGSWSSYFNKSIVDLSMVVFWPGTGLAPDGSHSKRNSISFTMEIYVNKTNYLAWNLCYDSYSYIFSVVIIFLYHNLYIDDIMCSIISWDNKYNNGWIR